MKYPYKVKENDPAKAGQLASRKMLFGDYSRYAVAPVHTRGNGVQWFVWDAERCDRDKTPTVIRQGNTFADAVLGLVPHRKLEAGTLGKAR